MTILLMNIGNLATTKQSGNKMQMLLSFAIGSILGDIFFHLIPESVRVHSKEMQISQSLAYQKVGISLISGIFLFIVIERMIENNPDASDIIETDKKEIDNNFENAHAKLHENLGLKDRGSSRVLRNENSSSKAIFDENNNISSDIEVKPRKYIEYQSDACQMESIAQADRKKKRTIESAGYLNLIANGCDNFTHGLAIGASFLAGNKVGLLTTFVVLIHEIPHEICDYAILIKSGFSRWDAVKAQSMTAIFGIIGTAVALCVKSVQTLNSNTLWILPFSAGGFLHIALVNIMAEVVSHHDGFEPMCFKDIFTEYLRQISCAVAGASFMLFVATL